MSSFPRPEQGERDQQRHRQDDQSSTRRGEQPEQPAPVGLLRVRRYPRFGAFLLTGAVLGLLIGVLLDLLGPDQTGYEPVSTLAFFGVVGASLGALIAALVAVLLDRRR